MAEFSFGFSEDCLLQLNGQKPFIKKSSDYFKDIYKLKLLTSFVVYMTSSLKGVSNYVLNH